MSNSDASDPGTLVVQVAFERPELREAGLPVQVRHLSMATVAVGRTGEPIAIAPGRYLVTLTLPGGDELYEQVEVAAGATSTVELVPPPAAAVTAPVDTARWAAQRYFTAVADDARVEFEGAPAPASPRTVHLRLLAGNPLDPPLRTVGAALVRFDRHEVTLAGHGKLPPLPLAPTGQGALDPDRYQLVLRVPDGDVQVLWLRVTAPPERTRFLAVPATPGETCTLLLTRARGITPEFHVADPWVDALLQYGQGGDVTQMRALLDTGVAADDPSLVRRLVVDYTVLRVGTTPDVDAGPALMGDAAAPLPDSRLIEAERAARRGEHERAQELFIGAVDRGLPMFSDGLGYLSTRVPQYLRLRGTASAPDPPLLDRLVDRWERLRPLLDAADLKPAILTLRGNVLRYSDRAP